jgi:hypothetical protein
VTYYVFFAESGQILAQSVDEDAFPTLGKLAIGQNSIDITAHWVKDGVVESLPTRPLAGGYWFFDYLGKAWAQDGTLVAEQIKRKRNDLLMQSDWTQIPNGPLTSERQAAWGIYRQALRDITSQQGYPLEVVWPTAPE